MTPWGSTDQEPQVRGAPVSTGRDGWAEASGAHLAHRLSLLPVPRCTRLRALESSVHAHVVRGHISSEGEENRFLLYEHMPEAMACQSMLCWLGLTQWRGTADAPARGGP
jgi:hypothetical protein